MFFGDVQVDPSWTFQLVEILSDSRLAKQRQDLTFPATLDQLESWLHDPREFERRHRSSWYAAMADFACAVSLLGPAYLRGLDTDLARFRQAMTGLPAVGAQSQVDQARAALRTLTQAAYAKSQLACAWQDVVDTARGSEPYGNLTSRIALLHSLLDRAGRSPSEVTRSLVGVLLDRRMDVQMARLTLGDAESLGPLTPQDLSTKAGVSEEDRLQLCSRLVTAPPRHAHHVVWHAFAKARLTGMVQSFGPITLYDQEWCVGNAAEDGPFRDQLPPEVSSKETFFPADSFPDGPHVVLARVDLGKGAQSDAPAVSRLQARSMILAATFPEDYRGWEMYEGYVHTVDGNFAGTKAFRLPEEELATPYLRMDATTERLNRMAPRIATHFPGPSSDLSEIIDAIGWWKASGAQPHLPAVVLDVRILELLATRVAAQEWYTYLEEFHKNVWIHHQVLDTLMQVAWHASDDLGHFPPDVRKAADALRNKMVEYKVGGFRVDIREVISTLPDLVSIYPPHSKQHRRATNVAGQVADSASMRAWYEALQDRWSRSLNRLRSVRNSLAHGGPIASEAAESVAPLAHFLAGTGLADSLNALLEGESQEVAHRRRRDSGDAWATRWLSGIAARETFSSDY